MATHSSLLAWTEEPGKLQSVGVQSQTRLSAHTRVLVCMAFTFAINASLTSLSLIRIYSSFFFFLAALGHCCCVQAFSSCSKWGLLFAVMLRLLILVASLVASTGSRHAGSVVAAHGLSCLVHSMWNLPRPGTESVSPTLAGGFLTTGPPGKP